MGTVATHTGKAEFGEPDVSDGELARLRAEHARLDALLATLGERPTVGARQQAEVARLKKLKLNAKDRMAALERARQSRAVAR